MSYVGLVILVVLSVGVILLQIFLSKRERVLPGLVLPIVSLLFSILFVLNMAMPPQGVDGSFFLETLSAFLLTNIPTLILLAVFFACRKRSSRRKQLDRMNIQDLD